MEDLEEYYSILQKPIVINIHNNVNEENVNGGNNENVNEENNEKLQLNKITKKTHNRSKSVAIIKHYKLHDYLN